MTPDSKPTREEIARALVAELGLTPESAAFVAGMHEDIIELDPTDLEITVEEES